ncbi:MAG: twin-arginine translocase subunit TatB [Alphaproteobacteria bacterium]|nr:twin-arginine translocase subunit TatB [Alphaproteobacteria bacterium]
MLDFGFPELLVIAAVAVLVIGPKELPAVMRFLGRIVRRLQYIRYAFSQQFEDFMRESDLDDLRRSVNFEEKRFDEAAADEEEFMEPLPSPEIKDNE